MSSQTPKLTVTSCILERGNREVLICLPKGDADPRQWEFPTGEKQDGESFEAAVRRVCRACLGVGVAITIGQPPFVADYHGRLATYRFFLATIESGEPEPLDYAEIRWIQAGQLCEYDYNDVVKPVVEWYTQ